MKNKLFIACMVLLAFMACDDDEYHSGDVHANTDEVNSVVYTSATVIATVYGNNITDRGLCWGTTEYPTISDSNVSEGSGPGSYTTTISGLQTDTEYYVRAYATYGGKTVYGSSRAFSTVANLTTSVVNATESLTSIQVKAKVANGLDGLYILERGVYYGTSANPQTNGKKIADNTGTGIGEFTINISGLEMETTYYIKSYVVSDEGTTYSEEVVAKTLPSIPTVFWTPLTSARLNYGIVRDGNAKFVMHYSFNIDINSNNVDNSTVTITYIETTGDKDAKHVTLPITFNDNFSEVTWTDVSNNGFSFSGITMANASSFAVKGTSGLTLDTGMSATDIYSMYTHSNYGGINRASEIRVSDSHHASIYAVYNSSNLSADRIEYNGEYSAVVGMPGPGYLFRQNKFVDGKPYMPITEDIAKFEFGQYLTSAGWMVSDPATQAAMAADLVPFLNVWENPNGVIIAKIAKDTKTPNDGGFYLYAISADGVGWATVYLRAYGS